MIACLALLIGVAGVTAAPIPPPLDFVHRVLDGALEKAWAQPEPRDVIEAVLRTAIEVDPGWARDRIRAATDRLEKLALPPERGNVQASLALLAAPHDRKLRDELLRRAIRDGRRSLAAEGLWDLGFEKPISLPLGDPQEALEQQKRLLAIRVRLCEAVLKQDSDPAAALRLVADLLVDAKKDEGALGKNFPPPYVTLLCMDLADFAPALFLAAVPQVWGKKETAEFAADHAGRRWREHRRDGFTRALITHAIENGVTTRDAFEVFGHYDLARAWAVAVKLPDDANDTSSPRLGVLFDLIDAWAWRDPAAALAAAEQEPSLSLRRDLIHHVSRAWAYKQPDQIERAIRLQDNADRRRWVQDEAKAELARRKQGKPPRDTRDKAWTVGMPRNSAERDAAGLPRGRPAEIRVLDNPKDTSWLKAPDRFGTLSQAAWISYFESRDLDGIGRIVAGLSDPDEADVVLCNTAERIAQYGTPGHATELLQRVKSSRRAIQAACQVARALARELEANE